MLILLCQEDKSLYSSECFCQSQFINYFSFILVFTFEITFMRVLGTSLLTLYSFLSKDLKNFSEFFLQIKPRWLEWHFNFDLCFDYKWANY